MQKHSDLLLSLLERRGIIGETEVENFLNPDYERDLHDPFLMHDMERACVRIYEAVDNEEKIVIYADYDCDGIPGAVILSDFFKKINYTNFDVYIPERNSEGYGLNKEAVESFIVSGVKLIITVDLGITAIDEVAQAEVDGIDVIITDHHLPHETLPRAYAILNPKVDSLAKGAVSYPEKMLCGSGVAFKLVQAMVSKYGELYKINSGWEKWLLDMAGLATLSDMVPLLGENRAIAYFGMMVLKKSPRPGLQKLLAKMDIEQKYLTEDDVGFMVTPRINAASRMESPMRAFELLAETDPAKAGALAEHLTKINDERKNIVKSIMREVGKSLEKRELREVIVVGNPKWRVGVLGLVAGKLMDQHNKPVFVWGRDENDVIKGSCRSPGSVSVVELMTATQESFIEYGGHELAGGFTVVEEKIHLLEESLSTTFHKVKRITDASGAAYDTTASLADVNTKNWKEIQKMAPFGFGNPKPVFLFKKVKIESARTFGKNGSGEHLEIVFVDAGDAKISQPARLTDFGTSRVKGIAFFAGLDSFETLIEEGKNVNLLATFDLSRFRGREELRLRIEDII